MWDGRQPSPSHAYKGRYFGFGRFLPISAYAQILKQRNLVKLLRIFSAISEIQKNLPLKAPAMWVELVNLNYLLPAWKY